ncbi:hypothetical protein A2572_00785 [Candidatus Collierbacteria bacterium RIFOXYD1_FULL_40_9]|uniref:M23ase beta-sheet core domain-containing protein n=1 Tax=Candidatus Collierbacteria bacterium RIFOXYD1_FULL_40_9 TaxID=1817731 RepID=A0A1F5FVX7_9BACT|nr:MAG: hypothetical protein A2572_00785 [Candidatus Collierbacteria bacterium RIFOXYD1_FULL_40_9]
MPETKDFTLDIVSLHITSNFISERRKPDQLSTTDLSFVSRSLNCYIKFQEAANNTPPDPNIDDIGKLLSSTNTITLDNIAKYLEKLSNQTDQPEKTSKQRAESDQNNIPAELESMVALYKQHQADLLDSEREHTISDTIKNIRKDWLEKEKHRLIYENADKKRQEEIDKQREKFFNQSVDPKKSYEENTRNIQTVAENILIAEGISKRLSHGDYQKAIDLITYSIQTGGVNINNKNSLFNVTQLIKKDFLNEETIIDKVDDLVQEEIKQNEINGYEDQDQSYDTKLTYAEQDINTHYTLQAKQFVGNLDKIKDFDTYQDEAKAESDRILNGLNKAIPNPRTLYNNNFEIDEYKNQLEKALHNDTVELNKRYAQQGSNQRIQIRPNSVGDEARISGSLSQTGGNISPTIVDLYRRGLTPQKLDKILTLPGSKTYEILSKNKLVQKQIHFQLQKFHDSKLGGEINKGLEKLKPLSDSYYRLSGTAQKILDPVGTGKDYLNKKIGQYAGRQILKNTSSATAQKFGKYLLENGLKEGAKKFADATAKKLLIEGAKAVGVQTAKVAGMAAADSTIAAAAVALGVPTAGLSLIIAAALVVVQIGYEITIGLLKKGWQEIKNAFGITDEDDKENIKAFLLGLAALAATAVVINKNAKYFATATKVAAVSALGIIWLSLATISVFLLFTFMVAPLLSTLVQFDSEEKVKYTPNGVSEESNNSECGWPIAGSYKVTQGPEGTATHGTNKLQAIDIWGPDINGKPVISSTDGKVIFAGVSGNYGNAVYIETTNSAGTFQVVYAHLSSMSVSANDPNVKKGQIIGYVGNTGGWEVAHIHLEYKGIDYNQCPAGGVKIEVGCSTFETCGEIMTGAINTIN